jgi:hypothetical protein
VVIDKDFFPGRRFAGIKKAKSFKSERKMTRGASQPYYVGATAGDVQKEEMPCSKNQGWEEMTLECPVRLASGQEARL